MFICGWFQLNTQLFICGWFQQCLVQTLDVCTYISIDWKKHFACCSRPWKYAPKISSKGSRSTVRNVQFLHSTSQGCADGVWQCLSSSAPTWACPWDMMMESGKCFSSSAPTWACSIKWSLEWAPGNHSFMDQVKKVLVTWKATVQFSVPQDGSSSGCDAEVSSAAHRSFANAYTLLK